MFNNVKRKHESRFTASTNATDPNPEQSKDTYDRP
jgi:GTPase